MPDYTEGKIYKILNSITDETYIGSTTQSLCNRMKNHRNDYNNMNKPHYKFKLYKCFREHDVKNFYIELIEKFSSTSKEELLAREGYYIRRECPSLNSRIAGRTNAQYYQDNKEKIKQQVKKYAEDNREVVLENKRTYHEKIKDTPEHKQYRKEYYDTNKEHIKEYGIQHREKNKDKLKLQRNEQIQCECGCMISRKHLQRHTRSQKHEQLSNC